MPSDRFLECPRREDDAHALITQLITRNVCEQRQRDGYHKCPRCLNRTIGAISPAPATSPPALAAAGKR